MAIGLEWVAYVQFSIWKCMDFSHSSMVENQSPFDCKGKRQVYQTVYHRDSSYTKPILLQ